MFGYVRPFKSELLVREYEQYKASYCQVCHALKEHYGRLASFTLSYDCTFYALLLLSVEGGTPSVRHGRCVMNPLKKCDFLECSGEAYHKAAALSVLLTAHKLRDNVADDSFWKSLGSRLFLPFVARRAKKAEAEYPFLAGRSGNRREWTPAPSPQPSCSPLCFERRQGRTLCRGRPWNASAISWAGGSI